jgi:crotonobetainyl-CoA:carnitine CoA-transferase CaiB-like acyl-CoA transferase
MRTGSTCARRSVTRSGRATRRYAQTAGRLAARDGLDAKLADWTRERDKHAVTEVLQRHGVPCGPMLGAKEQLDDPHFAARGYPRWLEQQDLGRMSFEGPCWSASGMSDVVLFQAPRLGEHTKEICVGLLGMDEAQVDRLMAEGALEGPLPDAPATAASE